MPVVNLLADLTNRGVAVRLDPATGKLHVSPARLLTAADRAALEAARLEIVEALLGMPNNELEAAPVTANGSTNRQSAPGNSKSPKADGPDAGESGQRPGKREPRRVPLRRRVEVDDGGDRSLSRIGLDRFHFGRFLAALPGPADPPVLHSPPTVHSLPGRDYE